MIAARIKATNKALRIEEPPEEEEVPEEEKEKKKKCRRVAFFVGGLALGAGGTMLAWWLTSKYGVNPFEHHHAGAEAIPPPGPKHAPGPEVIPPSGPKHAPGSEIMPGPHAGSENIGNYHYPWNWAEHEVGTARAETWLHELGNKAAQAGHQVEWHRGGLLPNGQPSEWISVDGKSNTAEVIKILSSYR